MNKATRAAVVLVCAVPLLASCSSTRVHIKGGHPAKQEAKNEQSHVRGPLKVPPGHMPRPGYCRVWIPGTPPGHQPKQGPCDRVARNVPPGAWLLHRPQWDPERIEVTVYDEVRVGVVIEVRLFNVETGAFISLKN